MNYYIGILLSIPAMLLSLSVHEAAHGWVSYKLGDPTARDLGRLTVNPLRHLDLVGALSLVLFHVGWAKPVPINPRNFKNPVKGMALTALAGPLSNFLMAIVGLFGFLCLNSGYPYAVSNAANEFFYFLLLFLNIFFSMNMMLGLFNLIPLPPLDGSRILAAFLPPRARFWLIENERKLYFVTLIWMLLGSYIAAFLLSIPGVADIPALAYPIRFLSVIDWIEGLANILLDLLVRLFTLIPFLR